MYPYNIINLMLLDKDQAGSNINKQRKILEAAVDLFAQKGYANTTTSEIAKRAEIAEGTFFRYYKTKEVLLKSFIETFRDNVIPRVSSEVLSLLKSKMFHSFKEMLCFFIKDRLDFIRENQDVFKVFVKELYYREDFRNECLVHFNNLELKEYASLILEHAKASGEISALPNLIVFRTFGIITVSYFVSRFTLLPDSLFLDDDTEVDLLVKQIISSLQI